MWLKAKYELYKDHHANKTLPWFFPSLYEEYFTVWPPTPTMQDVEATGGDTAVATAGV